MKKTTLVSDEIFNGISAVVLVRHIMLFSFSFVLLPWAVYACRHDYLPLTGSLPLRQGRTENRTWV